MYKTTISNFKIDSAKSPLPFSASVCGELLFLLYESRHQPSPQLDQVVLNLLEKQFDYNLFIQLSYRNGICPILAYNLKRLQLTVPPFNAIIETANSLKYRSIQYTTELAKIFQSFAQNHIRALSLKGPILAHQIYGNVSMRSYNDLDIWVAPNQYLDARNLLIKKGFVPTDFITTDKRLRYTQGNPIFHHTILTKGRVNIELHWKCLDLAPFSFENIYQRCTKETLCDTVIPTPDYADTICLLLQHGAHHGYSQLKWLMDLYELFQKADFSTLNQVCVRLTEIGSLFSLYTYLLLSEHLGISSVQKVNSNKTEICKKSDGSFLLKAPLLEDSFSVAKQLSEAAFSCITITVQEDINREEYDYTSLYRNVRYQLGLIKRAEEFRKLISPGIQDFKLIDLPDSLFFLYYPIRIGYWIWRRVLHRQSAPD